MRTSFAKLLTNPRTATRNATRAAATPAAASAAPAAAAATAPPLDVGWHESSYELMRGVDVIEFDASNAPLVMAEMGDL